jgi:hypothetical protein
MSPETLPLLLATIVAYAMLGAGTLHRIRRRRAETAASMRSPLRTGGLG